MQLAINILVFFALLLGTLPAYAALDSSGSGSGLDSSGSGSGMDSAGGDCTGCLENPISADNIQELFQDIIDIVLVFAIPIVVFFIIYAGFLYVTARGNEGTIERAHRALLYALIGGVLILGARVLIEVVSGTVNAIK